MKRVALRDRVNGSSSSDNYLLLSDVHLGSSLVSHVRPWRDARSDADRRVDSALVTFLEHYGSARPRGRPWTLVLAGDFIDFIGMSLPPPAEPLPSGLTDEERAHGLGSASDHAVRKLWAAAELHQGVFAALARFLNTGNKIIVVRGNHDIDLYWSEVRRAFIDALHSYAPSHVAKHQLKQGVTFCPWFFYVPNLLYVEHGHEFDPMCSYGDPLVPTCLRDPRRLRATPSDVMMRYVARPTPGLSTAAYEATTVAAYLELAVSLGPRGGAKLVARFAVAAARLLRDSLLHAELSAHLNRCRAHRIHNHVRRWAIQSSLHDAFVHVHTRSILSAPVGLARRLYLDTILLIAVAALLALLVPVLPLADEWLWAIGLSALGIGAIVTCTRNRSVDVSESAARGAGRVAELLPVKWVVMGHTHAARQLPIGHGQQYINLGHWDQDDLPEDRGSHSPAPCTHFVITQDHNGATGTLCRWDPVAGASPYFDEPVEDLLRMPKSEREPARGTDLLPDWEPSARAG